MTNTLISRVQIRGVLSRTFNPLGVAVQQLEVRRGMRPKSISMVWKRGDVASFRCSGV